MRVALIIPARNEAEALPHVLGEIPREVVHPVPWEPPPGASGEDRDGSPEGSPPNATALRPWHGVHDLIVVDNGSTDRTAEVARRAGARVVTEPIPGYGRACLAGMAALDPSVDTIVWMDGDGADDPSEVPKLLEPLAQDRADLVIGSRVAQAAPGSLTIPQRFGNRLACALMRWCFGVRSTDLGPFRAIRRQALERLGMTDQAFGWTVEMQAKAARAGLRVVEVPVRYRRRSMGRSKISGTLSGTLRAGWAILSTIIKVALSRPQSIVQAPRLNHETTPHFSEVSDPWTGQDAPR